MPPPAPCCKVGARPDVDAINAALNRYTVRDVLARFPGIGLGTLGKHRSTCLKAPPIAYVAPANGDEQIAEQPFEQPRTGAPLTEQPRTSANKPGGTILHFRRFVRYNDAPKVTDPEEQVLFIARLIEGHRFNFRPSLDWLALHWKLSASEVRDRYREAIQRVSSDKQIECAEKEVNLAAFETKEAAAMKEFRRLRLKEPSHARGYLALALKARGEYADLAGLYPKASATVDVDINIWTRPEFVMAVDAVVETSLDALVPQAEAEFQAMVREVEAKLGMKIDPKVAAAVLEIASGRMQDKLGAQVRQASGQEPAAAE